MCFLLLALCVVWKFGLHGEGGLRDYDVNVNPNLTHDFRQIFVQQPSDLKNQIIGQIFFSLKVNSIDKIISANQANMKQILEKSKRIFKNIYS